MEPSSLATILFGALNKIEDHQKHTNGEKEMNTNQAKKFWMITGDGNTARVRHPTLAIAQQEAQRLARANRGMKFFILETVEVVELPVDVVHYKL